MIPFCTENSSVGRPAMFHVRICTASPRVLIREKVSVQGIPSFFTSSNQCSTSSWRYAEVKAPR